MELLSPTTVHDPFSSTISSPSTPPFLAEVIDVGPNYSPGVAFDAAEKVHVAVSTSIKKGEKLLRWTFRQFRCRELVLIHVHLPSTTIPTPLGNYIPVKKANETLVAAHRRVEKEIMKGILLKYVNLCNSAKVKVTILLIENRKVHEGIVDLIGMREIGKLVMGTVSNNFMKGNKAAYTAKNAPPFCEIWFVDKDKHVGTRQATTYPIPLEIDPPPTSSNHNTDYLLHSPSNIIASTRDEDVSGLAEVGVSREEPFTNVLNQMELENRAAEDIKKQIKADEVSHALEINFMEELDRDIWIARRQKEQLLKSYDETEEKLRKAKESIAFLEKSAKELACVHDAKASDLKLIVDTTVSLNIERHIIRQQRDEARNQLEWWKSHDPSLPCCSGSTGISDRLSDFAEFCLSDLQTATCDFSERFKIGQGGYGCVYKGELLDRTVAIKKLHPHYRQGQVEFHHEVNLLSRLNHPNLVTITGACVEAWSLVSDYMPNGSLQDQLFKRTKSTFQWTWKHRVRVAAEISNGLMYMHSKPNKVIHGNLKPENILFDSNFSCKIGDFCICRLAPENTFYSPSFRRYSEFKGQFSYKDPEYERTGNLTLASDVYSFGIIVLQLLTGRPPEGLVNEVRQAMLGGKLSSVLDMTVGEWPIQVAFRLAEIGLHCCQMNSPDRLKFTEMVVREFQQMHNLEEKPVPNYFLCPILQEVMQDPQVAADGFTYEGQALRNWLRNGRDTSPMTNLKLDSLNLTPNHALRSAIQDWLRSSK